MKIKLDLPDSWIEWINAIPVHPDDDDTLERRLYDLILSAIDDVVLRTYQERDDQGSIH